MTRPPLIALCAAAVLAGCGGGDGDGGGTSSTARTAPQARSGQAIFTTVGCSTCHTLAAAGAKGQVGPNLDTVKATQAAVAKQVIHGGGGMPAFANQLSPSEIKAVARYVAQAVRQ
ncbi:c-type cytochrome [Baekduia sp. Peel2402]|uniref:c-type cytochrome n=1 Tax=Baekduia sp. Peel2402 TaxID=3458296 RepID=UPI00403EBFAE